MKSVTQTAPVGMRAISSEELKQVDIPYVGIAQAIAGFQRAEIVPLHIGKQTAESFAFVGFQSAPHGYGVEALPAVFHVGVTLVHVNVAGIEVQLQGRDVDGGGSIGVPAVGGQYRSVEKTVAFIALGESRAEKLVGDLVLRPVARQVH